MASIIKIKRSGTTIAPATLGAGELAYSWFNGTNKLYLGTGTETDGVAANIDVIGGKFFTDMLDHTAGTLTASSALIVDANSKVDVFNVDNLRLDGNTVSTTSTNGDLLLTPNGTGKTVITNPYVGNDTTSLDEYIFNTVGGAITAGTGITITNSDINNTSTVSITDTGVTAASYGSATAIPVLTINAQGQITAASTANIVTSLGIAGDTGTDVIALATDTLTFVGGTGITSSVNSVANSVTFDIDSTVVTLTGTQTLTNKTLTAPLITDSAGGVTMQVLSTGVLVQHTTGDAEFIIKSADASTTDADASLVLDAGNSTGESEIRFRTAGTTNAIIQWRPEDDQLRLDAFNTASIDLWTGNGSTLLLDDAGDATLYGSLSTGGSIETTAVTGTSGNLNITAAAGNNNVNLVPTGTGTVDVGNKRITSVAEPSQSTDAATKSYVDAVKTGLIVKDAVRVATNGPLTVNYDNGVSGVGATLTNASTQSALTIDSIVLSTGNRVLVKDQASALQNGIYVVTDIGSASTNWVMTRSTDFDNNPGGEVEGGDFVFVQEGTVGADNGYVVTTNGEITVGTTPITWVQFSGAGQVVAGDGLTKSGNTLNVVGTNNRISITADAVDIASTYAGQTSITTLGTIGTGVWQGTTVSPTYGGTGVDNGTKTITLGGDLTTSGAFNTTLTATANTNVTLPTTGTLATLAGSEALTNKTVNGLNITTTTGTLTVVSGGTLATAGAFSTTLTSTGTTNVTLPTTGTLATLAGTESLSNKTITASSFAGSVAATTLSSSGLVTFTDTTDATALGTAAVVLSGGLSVAKQIRVGTNITGNGTTSTLDGFIMDGGTY